MVLFVMIESMNLQAKKLFQDKDGRVVVWQSPNLLLWIWVVIKVVTLILNEGQISTGFEQLSTAVLFTWAVYELAKGVNYFRKFLGLIVLILIIVGYFS